MASSNTRALTSGLVTILAAVGFALAGSSAAYGQRASDQNKDKEAPPSIDAITGKTINEAIEFLNMDDYANAQAKLQTLKMDKLSPYEKSRVEQIMSNIAVQQEKYEEARQHLVNAIQAGGLNDQETSQLRYQIATLYLQEDNWAKGAEALEEWFKTAQNPNGAAYYLLAIAYYQQDKHDKAFEPAKKAVELTDQPQSSWIQLLLSLYLDKDDYKSAVPLIERLVSMEPKKKNHWVMLSSVYQQLEDYPRALAAMQVAYEGGMLTEDSEYRRLGDMLAFNEVPYRCAQVLEKAIADKKVEANADAYQKLANCWIAAREFDKSLDPMGRAAKASNDGDLYVRLAEVNVQREDWAGAAAALESALDKGKLKDTAYAQLLMGISLYNEKKPREARPWFERATKSEQRRKTASAYIQRIDIEAKEAAQATGG
jgi:Tfp pilus assembly protein PilF